MRSNIEFTAGDRTILRGWLYVPDGAAGPLPAVILTHGFSAVKEMTLDKYAEIFVAAGLVVLVYDHRNLGDSDGEPRHEVDPVAQMRDYRHAITYAQSRPEIDPDRIGLWGTSYSGALVLVATALDKRVKCVACQGPFISGYETLLQMVPAEKRADYYRVLDDERRSVAAGEAPTLIPVTTRAAGDPVPARGHSTYDYFHGFSDEIVAKWGNKVTLASRDYRGEFDALTFMDRISPVPLLMIVADDDTTTPTDIALRAYARALEPKKLIMVRGGHYAPYLDEFDRSSTVARDWFVEHLARG